VQKYLVCIGPLCGLLTHLIILQSLQKYVKSDSPKQVPFMVFSGLILHSWCQFHQHFYVRIFRTNVVLAAFSSYMYVEKRRSYEKFVRLTLMKLTPDRLSRNCVFDFFFFCERKTCQDELSRTEED